MIRADLLRDRKGIHVNLDKDVHAKLRSQLFLHGISFQQFFDEISKQFITGDPKLLKIIDQLALKKIKDKQHLN